MSTYFSVQLSELYHLVCGSELSSFHMIHSGIIGALIKFIPGGRQPVMHFTQLFMAYKVVDGVASCGANAAGFSKLVHRLNACLSQQEQFPLKFSGFLGARVAGRAGPQGSLRGANAVRFLHSHQIKCMLRRHPSCTNLKKWHRGPIKVDSLAQLAAIERYMLLKGYGRVKSETKEEETTDDDNSDDDLEEAMSANSILARGEHRIELLFNDKVLPYDISLFQAVRQYGLSNNNTATDTDTDSEINAFNYAAIWVNTHNLWYRLPADETSIPAKNVAQTEPQTHSAKRKWTSKAATSRKNDRLWNEGRAPERVCPLVQYLCPTLPTNISDSCNQTLTLIRILHRLNRFWYTLSEDCIAVTCAPVLPYSDFVNSKTHPTRRPLLRCRTDAFCTLPAEKSRGKQQSRGKQKRRGKRKQQKRAAAVHSSKQAASRGDQQRRPAEKRKIPEEEDEEAGPSRRTRSKGRWVSIDKFQQSYGGMNGDVAELSEKRRKDDEALDKHRQKMSKQKRSESAKLFNRSDQIRPNSLFLFIFRNGNGIESSRVIFTGKQLERGMNWLLEQIARKFAVNPRKLATMDGKDVNSAAELQSKGAYVLCPWGEKFRDTWYYLPDGAIDTSEGGTEGQPSANSRAVSVASSRRPDTTVTNRDSDIDDYDREASDIERERSDISLDSYDSRTESGQNSSGRNGSNHDPVVAGLMGIRKRHSRNSLNPHDAKSRRESRGGSMSRENSNVSREDLLQAYQTIGKHIDKTSSPRDAESRGSMRRAASDASLFDKKSKRGSIDSKVDHDFNNSAKFDEKPRKTKSSRMKRKKHD